MAGQRRTIVLIGATSGLGRAAADQLAHDGHDLILVGRDPRRVHKLAGQLPAASVFGADVSTADGVDRVVAWVRDRVDHVDVLINNAGTMLPTRQVTQEGNELNFAIHHLAPYSMTSGLLPLLLRGQGRVVNVNSEGHRAALFGSGAIRLDFDDLNSERGYDPFVAYSRSKLANLLFGYELQRRHPGLRVVAAHPGMVRSDLGRHFPRARVMMMHAISLSARKGAAAVTALATAPTVQPGGYYNRFRLTPSSRESYDTDAATRLWTITTTLRGPFAVRRD
jgi:NAD(P)-dependent dehydrogenase (short-subunit alcohol dehydrogenase family)